MAVVSARGVWLPRNIKMENIMKANYKNILVVLIVLFLSTLFVGFSLAGTPAAKSNNQTAKNYEMLEGVMSVKEGHGEFLVRLPDGKAQRFSVKTDAEITRNGKQARYNELKVSDGIQVQYDGSTREVIAIHAQGS
jgi:hypothetical protein